jgi:hypothetical protein
MSSSLHSTFRSGALLLALVIGARAHAQACCVSPSALFPARLGAGELAGVGLLLTARGELGSFDGSGTFVPSPARAREAGFEQRLVAAVQPLRNLQVNLALPFVETYRAASGLTEAGGGVGDLSFGARYDFLYADNPHRLPGFALLAAMTAPTGTPVELAHKPMATDATGQGMWQGAVGGTLDYEATPNLLLELFGQVAFRARRQVGGVSEQLAPQGLIAAAAAYVFEGLQVLALTASVQLEGDAWINGERVSGSARRVTSLGIFGAWPLPAGFTVQATLAGDLPISAFGQGQPAGLGVTVAVIKRW